MSEIAIDIFGTTGVLWPSDGLGGAVGIATASPTSTGATSTYTPTTATDSAFNPSSVTPALVPGCLITTSDGYYGQVRSFTAGVGGGITVDRWLHRNPLLVGRQPLTGTATFTLYTNPFPAGGVKTCCVAKAMEIVVERLFASFSLTTTNNVRLLDASGANLLGTGATGITWPIGPGPGTFSFAGGRRFLGIVGFAASHASQIAAHAKLRIRKLDEAKRPRPITYPSVQ